MLLNMRDLLKVANEYNFAIPAFNISSWAMFLGVMETTEEKNAPVIISIHPDELSHVTGDFMASIRKRAMESPVPVCIHLDHGASIDQVVKAIQVGYTSVMIDGSALPFEENIAICKEAVRLAHAVNVSVEGELGTIGSTDSTETEKHQIIYTVPEDAQRFVEESGVDTLAVAIGTSHGLYPKGMTPHLRLDILKEIKTLISIPLVLHGGSNNPDNEISESVTLGINKINISSDIKAAYYTEMRRVLQDLGLREPNMIEPPCIRAMQKVVAQKIELFRTAGKANLYS